MKTNVSKNNFIDAFCNSTRNENFSYDGLIALYEYLTDIEEQTGVEIELDVIALCCEFSEYESLEDFNNDRNAEYESLEGLQNDYNIIEFDKGFLLQE